ncbi:MAG: flagellar motor switch protein FliG [Alphaproteobacteria bacterium]
MAQVHITYKSIEKAAMILLALDEDQASKLFQLLDTNEIRNLSRVMAELKAIKANDVQIVVEDFMRQMLSTTSLVGTVDKTERLLAKAIGEESAKSILDELSGPAGLTVWDKMDNINEQIVSNYLKSEHPQTIALILSKLNSKNAAQILKVLPEALGIDVIVRILFMDPVRQDILSQLESTLRSELVNNFSSHTKNDTYETVAEIFNNFDHSSELRFLKKLESINFKAAERIRSLMFTFKDLMKIDEQNLQKLIQNIGKDKLALALKGAETDTQEFFLKNMSVRAARLLKDEMKVMGQVRVVDVEKAQNYVVTIARKLADTGVIFITKRGEEDERIA